MAAKSVIKGVLIIPMGFANAFLIEGDDGLTLIDAGYPHKEAAVLGAIRGLGRSPDQLKHLIFTHAHPDHIGSAAAIVRETGARTYLHPFDIPIAESGGSFRPLTPAPGLLGALRLRISSVRQCGIAGSRAERTTHLRLNDESSCGITLPGGFQLRGCWMRRGLRVRRRKRMR